MGNMAREGHRRSLVKAISWRVLGSVDTFVLSYVITGNPWAAGSIASAESVTKVVLYYAHERAWSLSSWGKKAAAQPQAPVERTSRPAPLRPVPSSARRVDTRSVAIRRGRSTVAARRGVIPVSSVARLPLAPGKQPPASLVLAFPASLDRPRDPMPAAKPKVSLWGPAKIGIAGALCTYLALTFGPDLLRQDYAAPRPGSDLADTRPEQPGSDADRPRFAQISPAAEQSRPAEEAPLPEPALAAAGAEIGAEPAAMPIPAARDVVLPPQRPSEASAETPQRDLSVPEQAEEVQRRLTRYGYLPAAPTGVWGSMSRQALRAFKAAHDLAQDDAWDQTTERALFGMNVKPADSFVGIWGADASACSAQGNRKGLLPAVIDNQGAMAGETFCAFKDRVKTNEGWTFTATCTSPRERWTTKVRLETNGNKLTWASQRGTQTYTRCERKVITAEMSPIRNR